ncbi:MAG: hypothetical protein ACR2IF_15310 [Terriglobales bacterium]
MLSKCANPACSAAFRFFHEGRLFTVVAASGEPPDATWGEIHLRTLERYWLCRDCAASWTVAVENGRAIVRRLPRPGQRVQAGLSAA